MTQSPIEPHSHETDAFVTASNATEARKTSLCFALFCVVQAILIFTITFITIPLPEIGREFSLSPSGMLAVLAAYGLPYSGLLLFGGRLSDRFTGQRLFLFGLAVFGIASAMGVFVIGFEMLVAIRFLQGVGAAAVAPAAVAVLRHLYPDHNRFGRAMAVWGSVSVLGATLGFLSGALTYWISWRLLFAIPGLVAALAILLSANLMPTARSESEKRKGALDVPGAVAATLGISLFSLGVISSGVYGWNSFFVTGSLAFGIVTLFVFFQIERRTADPLLPPKFLLQGSRVFGLLGMFLAASSSGLIKFVTSLYLQGTLNWSPLETAAGFLPYAVVLVAMSFFGATFVGRFGALATTGAGLLLMAIGFFLLRDLTAQSVYLIDILPGQLIVAVGSSLSFAGSAVLSTATSSQGEAGLAGGVMNTAMELGPTTGLALFMAVAATKLDPVSGYGAAFSAAALTFAVVGLVGYLSLSRRT